MEKIIPFMDITLFQLINYFLMLVFFVLFARYLWIVFFNRNKKPVQWHFALENGKIPPRLRRLAKKYPDKARFFTWWFQIGRLKQQKIPGVFAELGVYKGASAEIIHQMDPARPFHLFDTFSGFTAGDLVMETGEAATYTIDNFADTGVETVLKKIAGNNNIHIHSGYFPDAARDFSETVALVNIDADLYKPTKAGIEFFYPLLAPGGVILIHDYNFKWPGIIKAVDDFLMTIPETLIHLPDIDGTVMIIRNK